MWQAGVAGMNTMMGELLPGAGAGDGGHAGRHISERAARARAARERLVRWMDNQEEALLTRYAKATSAVPKVAYAVEYYLDHYFMTADPGEMNLLDSGHFTGWQRTGMGFNVLAPADATPMSVPVCRLYGNPDYGLNTHFYSASPAECADTLRNWPAQWALESSNVFRMALPDMMSGACPVGTMSVFRTWNQRADTNHRYTTDPAIQMGMMIHGGMAESYGNPPVVMCSPQ